MVSKELRGELVTLRILQKQYIDDYIAAFSPLVRASLHCTSLVSESDYLAWALEKINNSSTFFYCMFDVVANQLIGAIEIRNQEQCAGQLYSWLHESYWGTGRYQQALLLCAQEYFKQTMYQYFNAHVDVQNKRSYYALRKCGFAPIGFFEGPFGKQYDLVLRRK